MIRFSCDNCNKKLKVPYEYVSKKVKCPGCSNALIVPAPPEPEQPADEGNLFSDLKSDLEQMESHGAVDYQQNELLRETREAEREQEIDDSQWHEKPKKKKPKKESSGEGTSDMIKLPLAILLGCIGAAIGAGVWALVSFFGLLFFGGIASGLAVVAVGFVTGTGAVISGHSTGIKLGAISAIITLCAILGGKYIVVNLIADTATAVGTSYMSKIPPKEIHDYIRQDENILGVAAAFDIYQAAEIDKALYEAYKDEYIEGDFSDVSTDISELHEYAMETGLAWDRPTRYEKVMAWQSSLFEIDKSTRKKAVFKMFNIFEIVGSLFAIGLAFRIGMGHYSQV